MIRVSMIVSTALLAMLTSCEVPRPMTQAEYQRNVAIMHMFEIAHVYAPRVISTYGCYPNALGGQNCMTAP